MTNYTAEIIVETAAARSPLSLPIEIRTRSLRFWPIDATWTLPGTTPDDDERFLDAVCCATLRIPTCVRPSECARQSRDRRSCTGGWPKNTSKSIDSLKQCLLWNVQIRPLPNHSFYNHASCRSRLLSLRRCYSRFRPKELLPCGSEPAPKNIDASHGRFLRRSTVAEGCDQRCSCASWTSTHLFRRSCPALQSSDPHAERKETRQRLRAYKHSSQQWHCFRFQALPRTTWSTSALWLSNRRIERLWRTASECPRTSSQCECWPCCDS